MIGQMINLLDNLHDSSFSSVGGRIFLTDSILELTEGEEDRLTLYTILFPTTTLIIPTLLVEVSIVEYPLFDAGRVRRGEGARDGRDKDWRVRVERVDDREVRTSAC